jgi:hypothetical protein
MGSRTIKLWRKTCGGLEQPVQEAPQKSAHNRPERGSTFSAARGAAFTHSQLIAKGDCYLRRYTLRSLGDLSKH